MSSRPSRVVRLKINVKRAAIATIAMCCFLGMPSGFALQSNVPSAMSESSDKLLLVKPSIAIPSIGVPQQMLAFAAPDEPDRILVCTSESDPEHARLISAAYVSLDDGNTWMRTLLDDDSDWVSETACATGPKGVAYFAAGASDTLRGALNHSSGTAEIYRSYDGGLTWTEPRRYPFIDWMQLAIPQSSPAGTAYLFGNSQAAGEGDAGTGVWMDRHRLLRRSDVGATFSVPEFPNRPEAEVSEEGFPIAAVVLPNGNAVALFAELRTKTFALYEAGKNSYDLVSRVELPAEVEVYGALSAQMAYAREGKFSGRLYVTISVLEHRRPALVVAFSDDEGVHWKSSILLRGPTEMSETRITYLYSGIAVNPAGIVGIEWLAGSGCPIFAVSLDGGSSIADSTSLGACDESDQLPSLNFVMDQNLQAYNDRSEVGHPLAFSPSSAPGLSIRASANFLGAIQVAADAAGRFHAFWTEPGWRSIKTLTSTITVGKVSEAITFPLDAQDITTDAAVRIERQQFDPSSGTFDINMAIRNIGLTAIDYPRILQVVNDRSDCGHLQYLNALQGSAQPWFRVPRRPDREQLFPGEDSLPVHITVRAHGCEVEKLSLFNEARSRAFRLRTLFPLALRFHVYALPGVSQHGQ
jgi:hypothetical protein